MLSVKICELGVPTLVCSMINMEERHLSIVQAILKQYDYSFFVFGSRITEKAKRFSDLDLVYFENIPNSIILKLEEDFEESNLPYTVDLVNYNKCDSTFQEIIDRAYVCLQSGSLLKMVEKNHTGHFVFFPKILGFSAYEQQGLQFVDCGLNTSMFNIVFGVPELDISNTIDTVKANFKGQPFAWWIPPSGDTRALGTLLEEAGLVMETREHAMICDLEECAIETLKTDLQCQPVLTYAALQDFIHILEPYDSMVRLFYEKLTEPLLATAQEQFFVGYQQNKPVVIGILFNDIQAAGIFSLLTEEAARGKGYGTDMLSYLLQTAKKQGRRYVTLSASSDAGYRIYERLGFKRIGEFACFEFRNE